MSTKYSPNTYNGRKYVAGRRAIRCYTFLNASISNNKIGFDLDTFNDIKQNEKCDGVKSCIVPSHLFEKCCCPVRCHLLPIDLQYISFFRGAPHCMG